MSVSLRVRLWVGGTANFQRAGSRYEHVCEEVCTSTWSKTCHLGRSRSIGSYWADWVSKPCYLLKTSAWCICMYFPLTDLHPDQPVRGSGWAVGAVWLQSVSLLISVKLDVCIHMCVAYMFVSMCLLGIHAQPCYFGPGGVQLWQVCLWQVARFNTLKISQPMGHIECCFDQGSL